MEMKLICLILVFITIHATVVTKRRRFTRVIRVAPQDRSMYTLSSNTGIPNHGVCAMRCKTEGCLSFSYTEVNKRCDTYSRVIGEEDHADVAMSTMYFSKDLSSCSEVPPGSPSGVYRINPTAGNLLNLFCDMETAEGPWTVIQKRINGAVDFFRNWADYKNGFGDLQGDFWIGNDIIHLLTNTMKTLRVELEAWDGTKAYAQYSQFQVANEDQNYTLLVQGFSGNVSCNGLENDNGRSFTTYDRDNDWKVDANCAVNRHGGWWYNLCSRTNMNGRYQPDNGDDLTAINWRYFPSASRKFAPLKKAVMMIR